MTYEAGKAEGHDVRQETDHLHPSGSVLRRARDGRRQRERKTATRLIILGTQAGPLLNADRAQASNVLTVNGTPYLIDAGNDVARQLALAHVTVMTIHQIFISHNHDDRNADWGTLMGFAWRLGYTKPTTVYGPRGTEALRKGFLQQCAPNAAARYLDGTKNVPPAADLLAHDIAGPGVVNRDENFRATAMENCHYHSSKGTPGYPCQQSFAFRIETPDRVVVFSGDTGPCGDVLVDFAKDADIFMHEVADLLAIERAINAPGVAASPERRAVVIKHMREEHATPQVVGETASNIGVGRLKFATSGFYLEPTLFTNPLPSMHINNEEIFGRVASVIRVSSLDEALHVANDVSYGLSSGIVTTPLKAAAHFRRRSKAGTVMVNVPTAVVDYHMHFGGRGASSYGPREQRGYAAEFYTVVKTAYIPV